MRVSMRPIVRAAKAVASTLAKANPLRCCIHVDVEEDAWSHQRTDLRSAVTKATNPTGAAIVCGEVVKVVKAQADAEAENEVPAVAPDASTAGEAEAKAAAAAAPSAVEPERVAAQAQQALAAKGVEVDGAQAVRPATPLLGPAMTKTTTATITTGNNNTAKPHGCSNKKKATWTNNKKAKSRRPTNTTATPLHQTNTTAATTTTTAPLLRPATTATTTTSQITGKPHGPTDLSQLEEQLVAQLVKVMAPPALTAEQLELAKKLIMCIWRVRDLKAAEKAANEERLRRKAKKANQKANQAKPQQQDEAAAPADNPSPSPTLNDAASAPGTTSVGDEEEGSIQGQGMPLMKSNSAPASSTIPCSPKAAAPTSEQKVAAEDDISTAAVLKILISQKAGSTQGRMCSSEQLAPPTEKLMLPPPAPFVVAPLLPMRAGLQRPPAVGVRHVKRRLAFTGARRHMSGGPATKPACALQAALARACEPSMAPLEIRGPQVLPPPVSLLQRPNVWDLLGSPSPCNDAKPAAPGVATPVGKEEERTDLTVIPASEESRCAVPPPSPSDTATTRQSSLSPLTMPPSSPSSSCPSPSPDEDGAQTPTVADEESFELRLHRANLAYKQLSKPFYGIVREKAERYIGVLQYRAAGGTLAEFEAYKAALVKHTKEHDDVISIMLAIEDALPMCVQEEEHLPGVEKAINALALEIEDLKQLPPVPACMRR